MKLTNAQVIDSYSALMLLGQNPSLGKPRLSFAIAKAIAKVEEAMKLYEKCQHQLLEHHAERDADGKMIFEGKDQIRLQSGEAYVKDIAELRAQETDDLGLTQINVDDFPADQVPAPAILKSLTWLFV
jgi:hypothetical protein